MSSGVEVLQVMVLCGPGVILWCTDGAAQQHLNYSNSWSFLLGYDVFPNSFTHALITQLRKYIFFNLQISNVIVHISLRFFNQTRDQTVLSINCDCAID